MTALPRGALVALLALAGVGTLPLGGERADRPPRPHNCRFWGLVGSAYPAAMLGEHLLAGLGPNLRRLGGNNPDGWGFASFLRDPADSSDLRLDGPLVRRGGPRADHPTDPDYELAVREMIRLRPKAALGHVRQGSSGHIGIPDPHPFQHDGLVFAHNGDLPVQFLVTLLTRDDPHYLETHPPDYVNGHIDSELYFLYLLKYLRRNPQYTRSDALCAAIHLLSLDLPDCRLNFVLTDGDTLYALRYSSWDSGDPVRYYPAPDTLEPHPAIPHFWVVASQPLGTDFLRWGSIPERTLAVFVPDRPVRFLPVTGAVSAPDVRDGSNPSEGSGRTSGAAGPPRPNPTRGAVEFPLVVPSGGAPVALTIYDAAGREVWHGGQPALRTGRQGLLWDGRDARGASVPSGEYFCRVRLGSREWTERVAVVR